jgi:hypothetical protein
MIQMLLEHHKIPLNKSTAKIAMANYVNWNNAQYDLIGYESTLVGPEFIDRQVVLSNEFFYSYDLLHVARLFDKTLKSIFLPLQPFFKSGQTISCTVVDGKLAIIFPENAFDMDFRIVINQPLKNVTGFHTVPHETIPHAFVLVIKKSTLQRYTDGSRWVVLEVIRPSQMFPFISILFTSTNLQIRAMKRSNNNQAFSRNKMEVISDLILSVEDSSSFYDSMTYTPQQYHRLINVDNSYSLTDIDIRVLFETSDGYQIPLYLSPLSTCGILLKIDEQLDE